MTAHKKPSHREMVLDPLLGGLVLHEVVGIVVRLDRLEETHRDALVDKKKHRFGAYNDTKFC